ncbi:MAG: AsmA family protein [Nitrospirae bacterium]|nr:AsmA family protein [Nitrospirota bacterium]
MTLKRNKIIFITTGVLVLVVVAGIIAILLNIQAFKPQIEAAASDAMGMEVRIKGRLGIALFPGIGISLRDISVRNKGTDVVTVEKMKIGLKFIALTRREVRINRVRLIKPVLSLVRYKNGTFNFEKSGRAPSGRPLAVEKISIAEGKLIYTDESSGGKIKADNFEGAIQNLFYRGKAVGGPFKNISFDGDLRCKTLTINKLTLTNLVMRTTGENGIFEVNPVSMNLIGGKGKGSVHVDVTKSSPHYRLIAALNRFRIEEVIQAFSTGEAPRKSMEGTVNFSADLKAAGKNMDEVKRSLNGGLSLNGEDLTLIGVDIDVLIPKYKRSQNFNLVDVGAYFLVGPFGPVLTKSYNFGSLYEESRGGQGSIKKLVSIWKVNNGIVVATDVALASKKYRIAMKGGLNFNDNQFVDVTVAAIDKRGCAVYSQKVRGPFRKPQIEKVNVFRSLTGSVSNALEDASQFIQGKKCEVFYSGSVAHPE